MTQEERDKILNRRLPDSEVAKRIEEINTPNATETSAIIIEKVSYGMTIGDLKFGNVRPGVVEAILKPGKTLEEALDELDNRITAWHKKKYAHLYDGSTVHIPMDLSYATNPLPTISLDKERLEIQIDNCASLDELATFKELAGKAGLVSDYMRKLNELTKAI